MKRHCKLVLCLAVFTVFLMPAALCAQTPENTATAEESAAEPAAPQPAGVTIDLGFATAYNFRGLNVFGDKQPDQNMLFAPSLTYAILDTGLSIGYWGAYQVRGDNMADKVRAGAGHEQDLILAYSKSWFDNSLTFGAALVAYLYPFATEKDGGTKCPTYIEPALSLTYSSAVNLGLQVTYFAAIQDEIKDYRYLYIRPYISRGFELTDKVTQVIGLGYGYKVFNDMDKMQDNVHDIAFDLETLIKITDAFYVKPAFRGGWTNLDQKAVGEEYLLLGSFNMGFSI